MALLSDGHAPNLDKYLASLKDQPLESSIETYISLLKRRQIKGPEACAIATSHTLLEIVSRSDWSDVDHLLAHVSQTGRRLVAAQPREIVVGNIVRRVLGLIRLEAADADADADAETEADTDTEFATATTTASSSTAVYSSAPTTAASSFSAAAAAAAAGGGDLTPVDKPMTPIDETSPFTTTPFTPSSSSQHHHHRDSPSQQPTTPFWPLSSSASSGSYQQQSFFNSSLRHHHGPSHPRLSRQASIVTMNKSLLSLLSASPPPPDAAAAASSGASTPLARSRSQSQGRAGVAHRSSSSRGASASAAPRGLSSSAAVHSLRSEIASGIEQLIDEITSSDDQIAAHTDVHIQPGDNVLVFRLSRTVERFLLRAAHSKKKFALYLAATGASAPHHVPSAQLKKKLAAAGVPIVNILGSGMMAYMPRLHKVIIDAHAVMGNGSFVADAGAYAAARAARDYCKTVYVLSGVYRLCPELPLNEQDLVEWGSPAEVGFADGPLVGGVVVKTAVTEIVPGNLADVFLTSLGPHSRDYLSSIISEHYEQEDLDFQL